MLDAEHPDIVHVCTPHHLHAPMAIECLRRGVHVLLEKPVATTVADGEAVVRAAEASTATVGVCFQNRFNPTVRAIRDLLDAGTLGDLLGGRAAVTWFRDESYYEARPWRGRWAESGGGVLINQAIHTLDLLQWFLGDVTTVRGVATRAGTVGQHRGGGHRRPPARPRRRPAVVVLCQQRLRRQRPGHRWS